MKRFCTITILVLLASVLCRATTFPVDANGIIITGLSPAANAILGPLIPSGNSPWIFSDLAEGPTIDNMAVAALAQAPTLGTQLCGTVSHTTATQDLTTTCDLRAVLSGVNDVVVTWDSVDGVGTGHMLVPVQTVTATTITASENLFQPSFTNAHIYLLPPAVSVGGTLVDFQRWTMENPSQTWGYYDAGIGIWKWYYRTGTPKYLTYAQQYADIIWQWVLDHGYRYVSPRASAMLGQFMRALDGHPERFPGLYNWISVQAPRWSPAFCPQCDNREAGYMTWNVALGALADPDPTRHAQYCTWLNTYVPQWNAKQALDGSWGEDEYSLNPSFVSAPASFTAPFLWQAAPWRSAIQIKGLQVAYDVLNDTTSRGCNNTTLATATLAVIAKGAAFIVNYGRDTSNRGTHYEVGSLSDDQDTVVHPGGTVSVSVGSAAMVGVGTTWLTAGYCDGTHFIGIEATQTVYKILSCADNLHGTLNVAFGLYGESANVTGGQFSVAPPASTDCHSQAVVCNVGSLGDRNLVRTYVGLLGWLYARTGTAQYKTWGDEAFSASLGGPTAGLDTNANIGLATLPCSGPACDGYITDTLAAAPSCYTQPVPCVYGSYLYSNFGKNFGEAWGAPGIDNYLAWRLSTGTSPCDLNMDGVVNVLDVDIMVAQAVGATACVNRLDGGATCNVFDVQRVVVAALGGACRIGP